MGATKEYWECARECANSLPRQKIEKQRTIFSIWRKPGPNLRYLRPVLLEK